jgi:hypothetical protein
MMDSPPEFALRTGDEVKSATKAGKDRKQRPSSNQFSSKLIVSNLIFPLGD